MSTPGEALRYAQDELVRVHRANLGSDPGLEA